MLGITFPGSRLRTSKISVLRVRGELGLNCSQARFKLEKVTGNMINMVSTAPL